MPALFSNWPRRCGDRPAPGHPGMAGHRRDLRGAVPSGFALAGQFAKLLVLMAMPGDSLLTDPRVLVCRQFVFRLGGWLRLGLGLPRRTPRETSWLTASTAAWS